LRPPPGNPLPSRRIAAEAKRPFSRPLRRLEGGRQGPNHLLDRDLEASDDPGVAASRE
jgi:hypothetical protein